MDSRLRGNDGREGNGERDGIGERRRAELAKRGRS
jgi:hypothetical protein